METETVIQLSALAHPQRLATFRLILRRFPQAVAAGEVAQVLGLKASTASVYLSALHGAGLIERRRNGTSLLYTARMDQIRQMADFLFLDVLRGRADLAPHALPRPAPKEAAMTTAKYNVLFICSGNSARSIFAESLLRDFADHKFNAYSAGTQPYSQLNPIALQMLRDKGHDTSMLRSKHISEFQGPDAPRMDFVFTVCDQAANEDCPSWPGQPISAHWGLPDPVKATGNEAERLLAFQQAFGTLRNRIKGFAALPFDSLDKLALQAAVDRLGTETPEDAETI